jgi:hypothetical protein
VDDGVQSHLICKNSPELFLKWGTFLIREAQAQAGLELVMLPRNGEHCGHP